MKNYSPKIPQVCRNRILELCTTIQNLIVSTETYAVGSISAAIISCHQKNIQFELQIKDGETAHDTTTVSLFS